MALEMTYVRKNDIDVGNAYVRVKGYRTYWPAAGGVRLMTSIEVDIYMSSAARTNDPGKPINVKSDTVSADDWVPTGADAAAIVAQLYSKYAEIKGVPNNQV